MQRHVETADDNADSSVLPVSANGLHVTREGRTILNAVDVELTAKATATVILGPNGAGKSVLIRILAGLLPPDSGTVLWGNAPPQGTRAAKIGFVFQRPVMLRRTAVANIAYALGLTGTPAQDRAARAYDILANSGLGHLADTPARVLSGGEQQRLAFVRALACNPDIFFLDEPTSNLDPASTAAIELMIRDVRARGIPLVLITHDLGQARRLADDVIFMHRGRILERTPAATFFTTPQTQEAAAFVRGEIVL